MASPSSPPPGPAPGSRRRRAAAVSRALHGRRRRSQRVVGDEVGGGLEVGCPRRPCGPWRRAPGLGAGATSRSQAISTWPVRRRHAPPTRSPPCSPIRTWLNTAPPFWARPDHVHDANARGRRRGRPCRGSRRAVVTPVPPMPVKTMFAALERPMAGSAGVGQRRRRVAVGVPVLGAPSRVTKPGRSPPGRRSPGCRSTGRSGACGRTRSPPARPRRSWTAREQSPQPSQTSGVDEHAPSAARAMCRACGGGAFRWRRPGRRSGR